ncbi:MAG TPA: hypothetical protein VN969_26435 [Streptosporangiaceae bacterium]|nr:hypothetical protein [Streptosporangiaceae bacterium]
MIDPTDDPDVLSSGRDGPDGPGWQPPRWYLRAKSVVDHLSSGARITVIAVLACVTVAVAVPMLLPRHVTHEHPAPAVAAPVIVTTALTRSAGTDGVFARGTAAGRNWRLAVRDIADPGYQCQPGVTLNGTDAVPVFPSEGLYPQTHVGSPAFIVPGSWLPGAGFAFIQVPAGIGQIRVYPSSGAPVSATPVTVTVCGTQFHLAGFGYRQASQLLIQAGLAATYAVPALLSQPLPTLADPQVDGVWQSLDTMHSQLATATIATGRAFGLPWSIKVAFGTAGDCFTLSTSYLDESAADPKAERIETCGPISTPQGPDTIVALPLAFPADSGVGTGFAVSAGPGTSQLIALLTGDGAMIVHPVVVAGREYAAFFVPTPTHLIQLYWLAGGRTTTTTMIPQYGYSQS